MTAAQLQQLQHELATLQDRIGDHVGDLIAAKWLGGGAWHSQKQLDDLHLQAARLRHKIDQTRIGLLSRRTTRKQWREAWRNARVLSNYTSDPMPIERRRPTVTLIGFAYDLVFTRPWHLPHHPIMQRLCWKRGELPF